MPINSFTIEDALSCAVFYFKIFINFKNYSVTFFFNLQFQFYFIFLDDNDNRFSRLVLVFIHFSINELQRYL